ncbi:MAG: hypothetical protein K1Y02_16130 [Candidatus Hydrogenedentes bacterium]|nr:hypothetical protein [Candidatus Hydrogenedentota bacterium]
MRRMLFWSAAVFVATIIIAGCPSITGSLFVRPATLDFSSVFTERTLAIFQTPDLSESWSVLRVPPWIVCSPSAGDGTGYLNVNLKRELMPTYPENGNWTIGVMSGSQYSSVQIKAVNCPSQEWKYALEDSQYNLESTGIARTDDCGFVVCGQVRNWSDKNGGTLAFIQGFLRKLDLLGQPEWDQTFEGDGQARFQEVIPTADGGYLAVGYTGLSIATKFINPIDVFVVKTDAQGVAEWTRNYSVQDQGLAYAVAADYDGYIITGRCYDVAGGNRFNVFLLRIDSEGNQDWLETYSHGSDFYGYAVVPTLEGGYVVGGDLYPAVRASVPHGVLMKVDNDGDEVWLHEFGDTLETHCLAACAAPDGGFIAAGYDLTPGQYNMWAGKVNWHGSEVWYHDFPRAGLQYGYAIDNAVDGGYYIGGTTIASPSIVTQQRAAVLKIDEEGSALRFMTSEGTSPASNTSGAALVATGDGGYAIAGRTYETNKSLYVYKNPVDVEP